MARYMFLLGVCLVLPGSMPGPLYGWGSATHAYIARELDGQQGSTELTRIYGALLPDAFNVMFGDPYQSSLWTETHYEFMKLVDEAEAEHDKALAYGFAGHNEAWGADQTAHISAIGHPGQGYVIRKQDELAGVLEPQIRLFLLFSGVPNSSAVIDTVLPTVAHTAIETAVDLLVRQNEDRDVGQRLVLAARTRGWSAPILLCKAYAADFAASAGTSEAVAAPLIVAAESEFRRQIELYGTALVQDDPIGALAQQGADLARLLLAAELGIVVDIPADLMTEMLDTAIALVKDDYAAELAATVTHVRQELETQGITEASL
ncbi:MAG: hypothetical protein JSW27_21140 [Phycisphaerales bacterium]|nr:MAG: hypothetical protein JSW27_21140 [Phycisphaerales bacterium]